MGPSPGRLALMAEYAKQTHAQATTKPAEANRDTEPLERHEGLEARPQVQANLDYGKMLNRRPALVAQRIAAERLAGRAASSPRPVQPTNRTGLPDRLKSGAEKLSGLSLDNVKVHYNSSQPASLQARAFARGSEIHVGPGQEGHLPHETWHVVQQKQGRVRSTIQLKGVGINDDPALEREADAMGRRSLQAGTDTTLHACPLGDAPAAPLVQRAVLGTASITLSLGARELAPAPSSAGAVVQRDKITFGVTAAGRHIATIQIGRAEEKTYGSGAGDHGTAHITFRDWAQNTLKGENVAQVGAKLNQMMEEVRKLPGFYKQTDDEHADRIQNLEGYAMSGIEEWNALALAGLPDAAVETALIKVVQLVINFRNGIPLSTHEFGTTGGGEGHAAKYLRERNDQILAGAGITPDERAKARDCVVKLFDIETFSGATEGEDQADDLDASMMPGAGPGAYGELIQQHIASIAATYPALWAKIGAVAERHFREVASGGGDPKDKTFKGK